MQVIGLHIGGSFAEVSVWTPQEKKARARALFYLPRHSLRAALPKFLKTLPDQTFSGAFATSRHLERLFDFRLGGSTAQLVTAGFERWPFLNAAGARTGYVQPSRSHPISSAELTFGIDERIGGDGKVLLPLDPATLAPIAEKLKMMQMKRVCVHFLHAHRNPIHEDQAGAWFREQGFEVSVPPRVDGLGEDSRWRASTLEASFSGTFEEQRQDLVTGLADVLPENKIFIHDGEGFKNFAQASKVGTLFGDDVLLTRKNPGVKVLRLDLETWSVVDSELGDEWQSPWGPVAAKGPRRHALQVQPTCVLEACGPGLIGPTEKSDGFEPGPLSFGRGQKLMVFDLWSDHPLIAASLSDQLPEVARGRRDSALLALSRDSKFRDASALQKQLQKEIERWIAVDASEVADPATLVKTGRFAGLFENLGVKDAKGLGSSADRAALAGMEALK